LKPDPLRRLHLDLGPDGKKLTGVARTSIPEATPVQRAKVDTEVRALADDVSAGMTRPWAEAIRRASVAHVAQLGDRLDAQIAATDLGVARIPVWAGAVRLLQWVLIVAALGGGAWTVALAVSGSLGDDSVPAVGGIDLPIMLLVGGVVVGVLLALFCRLLVDLTARRRAAAAERRLRKAVHEVSAELVVAPVAVELDAYRTVRTGLDKALK
jgi:hypothetical protein